MKKYEYPLRSPNCMLYRKNHNNPIPLFALWDGGGCLEVYRTPDDSNCSLLSLDIKKDEYIYWYECLRKKPDVSDYVLEITRDIHNPKTMKTLFKKKETFTKFELIFSESEDSDDC